MAIKAKNPKVIISKESDSDEYESSGVSDEQSDFESEADNTRVESEGENGNTDDKESNATSDNEKSDIENDETHDEEINTDPAKVSSGDEGADEDSDNETDNKGLSNAGWADSVAKILKSNKPKGKKTLVLSKAKKLTDIKTQKVKPAGFEVATEDGDVKEELVEVTKELKEPEKEVRKKKKELPNLRVKPDILERDRERTLAKIATKGVVQLFNAVRMQQKDITEKLKEAGPLEVKKEKVLKNIDKRAFLDVLMGEKSTNVDEAIESGRKKIKKDESENVSENNTWSVLREDFMMGAKMKDWDKELEEEDEVEEEVMMESD